MEFITKTDFAYRQLREDIINGVIPPGHKLLVSDLSKKYNISAIPLRNAIARLEEVGLVTSTPHIGAFVASVNLYDYLSLMLLRIEAEAIATTMATINADDALIESLEKITEQMQQAVNVQDAEKYAICNRQFHTTLYAACNNPLILSNVENLMNRTKFALHTFTIMPQTMFDSVKEHVEWVEAIRNHDVLKSSRLIRYQRCRSSLALLKYLREDNNFGDQYLQAFLKDIPKGSIEELMKVFNWKLQQNFPHKTESDVAST